MMLKLPWEPLPGTLKAQLTIHQQGHSPNQMIIQEAEIVASVTELHCPQDQGVSRGSPLSVRWARVHPVKGDIAYCFLPGADQSNSGPWQARHRTICHLWGRKNME